MTALSAQPMLQSAHAEVLRLRVAIAISRNNESEDFNLNDYRVPKGFSMIMFSRESALNADAWVASGRPPAATVPLGEFYAGRFLVPKAAKEGVSRDDEKGASVQYEYSIEGTSGFWLPYSGGDRMCPERHVAKGFIIGTFVDVELVGDSFNVQPYLSFYPTGGLYPLGKLPFRIRRKTFNGGVC